MSVLIKDMEMPERCLECPLYDNYNYYCTLYSFGIPARYNLDGSTRPEWCEIKELPKCEDAVSRQAIIKTLNEMDRYVSEELILCDTDKKFPKNEVFIVDDVYEEIVEKLPSAQPERKKGKWIRNDNGTYSCSVCQSWIPEEQHYYAQYCLYCGADMRGEENEAD